MAVYLGPINPHFEQLVICLRDAGVEVNQTKLRGFLPLIRSKIEHRQAHILHLHWLTSFWLSPKSYKSWFKSVQFWVELIILRMLGMKLVWTIHNKHQHEQKQPGLEKLNQVIVGRLIDQVIVHCEQARSFAEKLTSSKVEVIGHSHYIDVYPNKISRTEARKKLGFSEKDKVLLFFGNLRPYKGVEKLIRVFGELQTKNTVLVLAGWAANDYYKKLKGLAEKMTKVVLVAKHIPQDEVEVFFNAAEVVVLPFNEVLSSGSLMLAFSFAKPVVAPKVGCVGELLKETGGFPYDPKDNNALKRTLLKAIATETKVLELMGKKNLEIARSVSPVKEAMEHKKIYSRLIG